MGGRERHKGRTLQGQEGSGHPGVIGHSMEREDHLVKLQLIKVLTPASQPITQECELLVEGVF